MSGGMVLSFEGREVRFVGTPERPEWVAADVCAALGIADPSTSMRGFAEDERGRPHTVRTSAGERDMATVTEPGLYRLVLKSRKPEAARFRRWVTHEVLPQIRRTGSYGIPAGLLDRVAFLERALLDALHNGRLVTETSAQAMGCVAQALALHGRAKAVQEAALGAVEAGQRMLIPGAEPLPLLAGRGRGRPRPTREQLAALLSAIDRLTPGPLTAREILDAAARADSGPVAAAFAPFGGRGLTPGALGGLLGRIREASYDGLAVVSASERRPLRWAIRRADQGVLGADAVTS